MRFILRSAISYFGNNTHDKLRVVFANKSEYRNYTGTEEPRLTIVFKTRRAEWWSTLFFYQGIVECYIDGSVDLIADFPMQTLTDIGRSVMGASGTQGFGFNPLMALRQWRQEERQDNFSHSKAKENAIFHYGHDPRFFELMLGKTVGYSEGFWTENTKTLDQAKVNNYEYICKKLQLKPGEKVIEVGAGWGFLPIYMVKKYGVRVTVFNPVPKQNEYMRRRFKAHGVDDRIELVEGDHRDIAARENEFDKYVSIGVYEHAGFKLRQYDSWLTSIQHALKPGGTGLISTTTFMEHGYTEFLVLKYIFPGGHIPSLPKTLESMDKVGLALIEVENLWPQYQKALMAWRDNLYAHWDEIHALNPNVFTESFRRAWLMYLEGTVDVFAKRMDLSHILFVKGREVMPTYPKHNALDTAEFVEGDAEPECYNVSGVVFEDPLENSEPLHA